jgi:NAD(P)-dependent dehydrogenase (short-subunit alcohol dehydrogenase family)
MRIAPDRRARHGRVISRVRQTIRQEQGRGVILNIGWDQSDRGMEGDSGELFAAAKNAVMGFSRSLAVSLAPQRARQLHRPRLDSHGLGSRCQ